jgi:hypothetical protein
MADARQGSKKRSPTDPAALVDGAKEKGENLREKAPCFLRCPNLARSMPKEGGSHFSGANPVNN